MTGKDLADGVVPLALAHPVDVERVRLVILGLCHRSSNSLLGAAIEDLKGLAPAATVRAVRRECEAVYPSASSLSW